jgi:hypothetical protein
MRVFGQPAWVRAFAVAGATAAARRRRRKSVAQSFRGCWRNR